MRAACINATTLALIDAGIAMEDFVCACTAGAVQSALLLDMNAQEDMAGAELTAGYLPRSERVGHLQLTLTLALSLTLALTLTRAALTLTLTRWATCSSSRRCRSRAQTS